MDRIVIVDTYDSTELNRVGEEWFLFGEEECNQTSVENLLIAASRLEITSVFGSGSVKDAEQVPDHSRKIAWYHGKKELLSYSFSTVSGKYLLRPTDSDKAYYVRVSAYPDLDLDMVFSSRSNHYREHLLIDLLPSEISLIHIQLPDETFRFLQDSTGNISLEVQGPADQFRRVESQELAVRLLFSYFTSIRFDNKSGIAADSLPGEQVGAISEEQPGAISGELPGAISKDRPGALPLAILQVSSFAGEKHNLSIYPYFEPPYEEAHLFKALVVYNQEPEALLDQLHLPGCTDARFVPLSWGKVAEALTFFFRIIDGLLTH